MMMARVLKRLADELIPAPTLGRLRRIKRRWKAGRLNFYSKVLRQVRRNLSPEADMRLRSWWHRFMPMKTAEPSIRATELPSSNYLSSTTALEKSNRTTSFYFGGRCYTSLEMLSEACGRPTVDMAIACAFMGRHEAVEIVVGEATGSPEECRILMCLAGSTKEDGAFLLKLTGKNPNVCGMLCSNLPVGAKWQRVVDLSKHICDFDLLGITGSDDVLPGALLRSLIDRRRAARNFSGPKFCAPGMYGTMEWVVLHDNEGVELSPALIKCSYKLDSQSMPLGAGRFYSREAIDEFGSCLFDKRKNRHLDKRGMLELQSAGYALELYTVSEGAVLSVKGDWEQMNTFNTIVAADTVSIREFSFDGYHLLRHQLSDATYRRIFDKH